jgi:transposase
MKRFVEGADRGQSTLFPECLDDWIDENNPVRVIDAFVDTLALAELGFAGVEPAETGRPAYHPSALLKLYVYGYLNRVQSSRRLEREAGRNVELMWLIGRLVPDHKTVADFRKDNGRAIRKVCARFVELCREMGLLVNAEEMQRLDGLEARMLTAPDQQISLTDPDSRSMATSGRGSGVVGYNVQVAVDTEHHLIVTHEVTNVGSDRSQLTRVAKEAKAALQTDTLEAVADRGYFNGEEIVACDRAGITVTMPKPMTPGAKSEGRFGKQDFAYLPEEDVYRCPAGERLKYYYTNLENGLKLRRYWTNACRPCALKSRCTTAVQRRITWWEHEHVLEAVQTRLDEDPQAMRRRRETVEHPFGTIKARMGATHFLVKTLPRVAAEMALHVLAYNLTRVINIMGPARLIAAIRT